MKKYASHFRYLQPPKLELQQKPKNILLVNYKFIPMKKFRRIYIYKESRLPERGWLHGCFICYCITGRLLNFTTIESTGHISEYVVHVCPLCQKKLEKDSELYDEYVEKCNKYIATKVL